MAKFIALIKTERGCDYAPDCGTFFERIEADSTAEAWAKLIKSKWGDWDVRLGGSEDPRDAVKNDSWVPIKDVKLLKIEEEHDSTIFDRWYEEACEAWDQEQREAQEVMERAQLKKLQAKYGN